MEHLHHRVARLVRRRDDAGVTLIEVVIASVLLGILASAILGIVLQSQAAQVGNRARVAAANLAAREIDMVREEFVSSSSAPTAIAAAGVVTNPHPLAGGSAGQPLSVDGKPYTVTRAASWNITGNGQSACEGGSLVQHPTLTVTVTVTWPDMGSIKPVTSSTVLAPQKGTGIPTTAGFVAVTVRDAAGQPNPGRTVRVANGSDIRSGLTDASGCAVVEVSPGASGTDYTVSLNDAGYVDIGNNPTPSKTTGVVQRGTLNNSLKFAYDRAGTVRITVTGVGGSAVNPADLGGSEVTLMASEYSGTTGAVTRPLSGTTTVETFGGLWPTVYGAYLGNAAPSAGYVTQKLTPGGTIDLSVEFAMATTQVTGMPAGTTAVWASRAGTGAVCGAAGARQIPNPNAVTLPPGDWDFYAQGAALFGCSPGPASEGLVAGANPPVEWSATSLRVTNLPPTGTVWAVERSKVANPGAACPAGGGGAAAQNIDAVVRSGGAAPIAAGEYYVFLTNGPANGTCLGTPAGRYPWTVGYGQNPSQLAWPSAAKQSVTVTGVPNLGCKRSTWWGCSEYIWPVLLAAPTSSLQCTATTVPGTPEYFGGASPSWNGTASYQDDLAPGVWYVYRWDNRSGTGGGNKCSLAATVTVGTRSVTVANGGTAGP